MADCATLSQEHIDRLLQEEDVVSLFRAQKSSLKPSAQGSIRSIVDNFSSGDEEHVTTPFLRDQDITSRFLDSEIPENPIELQEYLENIVPSFVRDSVHVGCSRQIGHMTGTLPSYIPALAELVTKMNQNVVKTETANTVTRLEKQVGTNIHRLIYKKSPKFYEDLLQDTEVIPGTFTSGGTIANITGLWIARNGALGPDQANNFKGVEQCGMLRAAAHYGYTNAVIVGSAMMHYSLKKAADVLGIGVEGLETCGYDENFRVNVDEVEQKLEECKRNKVCVIAVVGIAGATETGSIDDLQALAALARKYGTHFHVDAAWGGPCLFSETLSRHMAGIELADTVTIDGHKQLFMPMGCGMLVLRNPAQCSLISKTASYIIRKGSSDMGRFTLEGSRPANAIYMHANLSCIGAKGYAALMNRSARICRYMASTLRKHGAFDVLFEPMTNILLYRYVPASMRDRLLGDTPRPDLLSDEEWKELDEVNVKLQAQQKLEGSTFVSRTSVNEVRYGRRLVAMRVVIGNPITEEEDIDEVIADQLRILSSWSDVEAQAPSPTKQRSSRAFKKEGAQEEYWRGYWERMPPAARSFFMDDMARFQSSLVAPSLPSQLQGSSSSTTASSASVSEHDGDAEEF